MTRYIYQYLSSFTHYPPPLSPHVGTCVTIYPALLASSQPSSYILVTYSPAPPTHCRLSISEFLLLHILHLVPIHTSRSDFRRLPHILLLIYIMITPAMHASSPSLLKSP